MRSFYLSKKFARDARRAGLGDDGLREAVVRAEEGLVDADLGSGLVKQRVPREGEGRSGGFRTVLVYRRGELAIFVHLFAKNRKADLEDAELKGLRAIAKILMGLEETELRKIAIGGRWKEIVVDDGEKEIGLS